LLIVGELINASRPGVAKLISQGNSEAIHEMAASQIEAGADYLDVNAGTGSKSEAESLAWLVQTVQSAVDAPCCLDSPDPKALEQALAVHNGPAMINSISLEKQRWDGLLPLLKGTPCSVVALCVSDEGMPETTDQRLKIADRLIHGLTAAGLEPENIFVDPLVQPVSVNPSYGPAFLNAVSEIKNRFPKVKIICGLSNASFGLPLRFLINRTLLPMAVERGLDAVILDPTDRKLMSGLRAALALSNRDPHAMGYVRAFRAGGLEE
jgi:cobalamin-dependent methionine synthase I